MASKQFCLSYCRCLGQMSQRLKLLADVISGSLAIFYMLFRLSKDISGLLEVNSPSEQ